MGFWSINPYVGCAFGCAYCYARDTHRFTLERAGNVGRDDRQRHAAVAGLRATGAGEGARGRAHSRGVTIVTLRPAPGDSVVIGSATDPYQPAERRFRVTREILESLAERTRLLDRDHHQESARHP